jgi:integrase
VLTVEEVRRLIDAVRTPHNKAYLWTVYSLGLRLQEGLHLQVGDVDSQRMLVHVHRGKGAKDRYVPLPAKTLTVLREYWASHRNPVWLFPATGRSRKEAPRPPSRWARRACKERCGVSWCNSACASRRRRTCQLEVSRPVRVSRGDQ